MSSSVPEIGGKAELIGALVKVKDSYNVNRLSQVAALAALEDTAYFGETIGKMTSFTVMPGGSGIRHPKASAFMTAVTVYGRFADCPRRLPDTRLWPRW